MTRGYIAAILLPLVIGLAATAQDPKPSDPPKPTIRDRFQQVVKEFDAQQDVLRKAVEKARTQGEQNEIYARLTPDDTAYSRRMIELALSDLKDPAARDALIWVISKPYRGDSGDYGDEFARAAALLVRYFGDDPEAVRIGIGLSNVVSSHRDMLLSGFLASAKSRESKALARMALGQYLAKKARFSTAMKKGIGERRKRILRGVVGDDGKPYDKEVDLPDEQYAYELQMRLCDPVAMKAEAERLLEEVAGEYSDIPYTTAQLRRLEAMLKEPTPTWNGKPMTPDEIKRVEKMVNSKRTLGDLARAELNEIHNLAVGKPAPEIDGVDVEGKPLKLSDYKGKVVMLSFWGSWCGPCMRVVPQERELVERLKGKPFALLGVDCNETREAALKTIKLEQMTWPNWHDGDAGDGPIVRLYHIRSYPTVFVIDAKGLIRANTHPGPGLDKFLDELLKEVETKEAGE